MNLTIQCQKAFTLIELSIVLLIISLLLVGLLGPVGTQIESQERQQTIDTMQDIIESLYGFALVYGRLPCPDTDGDGVSDPNSSASCIDKDGWLPWQTLGINVQGDVWGNRFKYHVTTPGFTVRDNGICNNGICNNGICNNGRGMTGDLDLCQKGDITVWTRGDDPSSTATIESKLKYKAADQVPAVVISHGKNALGATKINGAKLPAATAGTDEAENTDKDDIFYSRTFSKGADGCTDDTNENNVLCEFDDIVMWVSPYILKSRMVQAEVLP